MPEVGKLDDMMPAIMAEFRKGKNVRMYPMGSSMLPLLVGGRDSVLLSPKCHPLKKNDIALYKRPNGQYVLHRVVRVYRDGYDFCGDNQVYLEKNVHPEWIIAKVISFTRAGKPYTIEDACYRIYCWGLPVGRVLRLFVRRVSGKLHWHRQK